MSEAQIAVLETRVDTLEEWAKKHELDDQRNHKYQNNMLENLLGRLAGIEQSAARFETDLMYRNGSDVTTQKGLSKLDERVRNIERLVWIAVGGLVVVGSIMGIVGSKILTLLGGS